MTVRAGSAHTAAQGFSGAANRRGSIETKVDFRAALSYHDQAGPSRDGATAYCRRSAPPAQAQGGVLIILKWTALRRLCYGHI